jgi:hypothetical protein
MLSQKFISKTGMLTPSFAVMDSNQFNDLPNSTNAVESHNRFGKSTHRLPLKLAMMATYREDVAKCLEIMATIRGISTSYEDKTPTGRVKRSQQQNSARRKRLLSTTDDAQGPPDKRTDFQSGMNTCTFC